jgi:hypothetical protein
MPYENEYNQNLANEVDALNRKFLLNEKMTLDPKSMAEFSGSGKLSGGFLGALAGAVLPMLLGKLGGGAHKCECDEESLSDEEEEVQEGQEGKGMSGGAMYNTMRDKMEGMGKASKAYKKQSEDKYNCGMGMSGGSAFGVGVGSVRDTGEGVTDGQNLGMGKSGGKKRGRKSKMGAGVAGAGVAGAGLNLLPKLAKAMKGGKKRGRKPKAMEGAGIISDLGIPLISNVAGLFGLGQSGGARSDPFRPEKFYPKVLAQTAPTADKSVPPAGIVDSAQNIGSNLSGFGKKGRRKQSKKDKEDEKLGMGKSGGRKSNPWMDLMAKVRKEHPELKGVKAVAEYIKKNNLYKK